jgi:8-oxo-dGTP pyrophosphatase MutT (NUDIX family)
LATLRHTRYQAAIIHEGSILLVCCAFRDGRTLWMLPGGGREEAEDELACVAREVLEETALTVRVERLLLDCPARLLERHYQRWRTFLCSVISGQPVAGGGEGDDVNLVDIRWLSLRDEDWPDVIRNDAILAPQLCEIRECLRLTREGEI